MYGRLLDIMTQFKGPKSREVELMRSKGTACVDADTGFLLFGLIISPVGLELFG